MKYLLFKLRTLRTPPNTPHGENTADVKGDDAYWLLRCVQG
jgi:hypothetical protein